MESLFTDKKSRINKDKRDAQEARLDEFTQVFKESLDVLNSINEISAMREKAGKIKHTYNLKKRYSSTRNLKKVKRPMSISAKNLKTMKSKNASMKNLKQKKKYDALWESKQSKLRNAIKKNKKYMTMRVGEWKDPSMEGVYRQKLNHGNINLYETFKDTMALPRVKQEFYQKPQLKLQGLMEREKFVKRNKHKLEPIPSLGDISSRSSVSKSSDRSFRINSAKKSKKFLKPMKLKFEEIDFSKKKISAENESESMMREDQEKKREDLQENGEGCLERDDVKYGELFKANTLESKNDKSLTDTENTEELKQNLGDKFHAKMEIDTVNEALDNIKTHHHMSKKSEKAMLRDYKYSKSRFDLAINGHNLKIFENYIKNITDMEKAFPIFKVKNLKNFNDFPLENYDTGLDSKVDIQFFIESRKRGRSRWFDSAASKFVWADCEILAYDDESKKFLIQWDNGAQKEVRRLNLMFEHEDEAEMESRRLKSHFFRCMHLFRLSLMNFVTGKEGSQNSNIFFSFTRFKNILVKIGIPLSEFNKNPDWMDHLEQMFNEFGVSLITFYINFKTSKNLDKFFQSYKLNDKIKKRSEDYFEECIGYGPEDQFEIEELQNEDDLDLEVLKVKYKDVDREMVNGVNYGIKGIFKTLNYYGLMDIEMIRSKEASRVNIVNKSMRSFDSYSEAASPTLHNSHSRKPITVKILKLKSRNYYGEEMTHISEDSSDEEDDFYQVKMVKEHLKASKNIMNIRVSLLRKAYRPFHIFMFYRTKVLEKIEDLKTVNIFQNIEDMLRKDKSIETGFPLIKFDSKKAKECISELEKRIHRVQVEIKYMCDELQPKDYNQAQKFSKKFKKLITAVNSLANDALITMMKYSCKSFLRTIRFLSLGFNFNHKNNEDFDLLLSEKMFKMKHKAMIENKRVPFYMEEVAHPSQLFSRNNSDLKRRITLMEKLILKVFENIHNQAFIRRNIKDSLGSKLPSLAYLKVKVTSNKKKMKAFRKLSFDERKKLRTRMRKKIYQMKLSMEEDLVEIRESYLQLNLYFKPDLDIEYMMKTEYKQVGNNILCDFCGYSNNNNFLTLSPSMLHCEEALKISIEKVLMKVTDVDQIKLDRFKTKSSKYQFGETRSMLMGLSNNIDTFLCDMILPVYAFMYYLNNFEYLLVDSKELISYEVKILDEKNNIGPLETEIKLLKEDYKLIHGLPDVLIFAGYKFDITAMKSSILNGINSCILKAFNETIGTKFKELLMSNKTKTIELKKKLRMKATNIETYIELKKFLEGEDLRTSIEKISQDIQLCKAIYDFMSDCEISSEETLREYLTSLNWVRDLKTLHQDALRRMKDEMPRFIKEINIQADKIFDDFERIEKKIKLFDSYYEIQDADNYSRMARSMSQELTQILKRAYEVNQKQKTLDYQETDFSRITNASMSFTKYVELWTFIAERWNIGMERWLKRPFKELDENDMAETINYGLELLSRLNEEFDKNEKIRAIITQKLHELEKNQKILDHVMILKDPCFKDRHWDKLFDHMKESDKNALTMQKNPDLERITLNDLLEIHLLNHTQILRKILAKAKQEAVIEERIMKIKDSIKQIKISPTVFDLDNIGLSIIPDVKKIIAVLNDHYSICKTMLANPEYPEEFSKELNTLSQIVESTRSILQIIYILQNKLIKFSPIFKFNEIETYLEDKDTVSKFLKLREDFMVIMKTVNKNQMNYFISLVGDGDNERITDQKNRLRDLNETAESVYKSLRLLFKTIRTKCPRYFFLSEEQMLICCSLLKFPQSLMAFIATMFGGVSLVKIDNQLLYRHTDCMKIISLENKNKEEIIFEEPIEIDLRVQAKIPLISIVKGIETLKDEYFMNARQQHIQEIVKMDFDFKKIWIYSRKHSMIFQVLVIIINLLFDQEMVTLFAIAQSNKKVNVYRALHELRDMVTKNYSSFQSYPYKYLGGSFKNPEKILFFNQYILYIKYFEEKLTALIEAKVTSFLQFEFLSLPKYTVSFDRNNVSITELTDGEDVDNFIADSVSLNAEKVKKRYSQGKTLISTSRIVRNFFSADGTKISINIMDNSFDYQNEFVTYNRNLAIWPVCDRSMLSIFTAMNMKMNVILKGFSNQGKTETVRIMSNMLATNYIECETRVHLHPDTMINLLSGVVSGGYWLLIKNLERCSFTTLSILANYANTIKESIMMNSKLVKFEGKDPKDLLIKENYGIFATFRVTNDSHERIYESIPLNLLDSFRTVSLVKPNYTKIIEHMVTFVMSRKQSRKWANKILLYSKMYKNVENFDFVLKKEEKIESAKFLNKSDSIGVIDLDMKLISFFIYVATLFYFGKVDEYYKKYDQDKNIYAYMKDKNIIKVEFNKVHHFTSLFKFTLNLYLKKRGTHITRLKVFNSLFDKVFEEELSSKLRETAPKHIWKTEEVGNVIKEFMKYEPFYFQNFKHLKKEAMKYVELLTRDPNGRQYIIYGKPDSQKSKFLKLLAFIESNMKKVQINFDLFWFNLECLDNKTIFGSDDFVGILREIFMQCHNMNNEEKATNTKKLNHLFQSTSELYSTRADFRQNNEIKKTKLSDRGASWVIIDSNSSKHNIPLYQLLQKIMEVVSTLNEHRVVNQFLGFSRRLRFFYEVNSLALFDPKAISENSLIYLKEAIIDPEEAIGLWFKEHGSKISFFNDMQGMTQMVWLEILIPYLNFIEEIKDRHYLLYYTSKVSLLNNFLSFFLIFFNELRKYLVIHELYGSKKRGYDINKSSGKPNGFGFNEQTNALEEKLARIAQKQDGLSFISNLRSRGKKKTETNQLKFVKTDKERKEFIMRKLEALTVFCIIYSIQSIVLDEFQHIAQESLKRIMTAYTKKREVPSTKFADGVFKIIGSLILGVSNKLDDYNYDLTIGQWVLWHDIKLNTRKMISSDFTQTNFVKSELLRLNCVNQKAMIHPLNKEVNTLDFIRLEEKILVNTKNSNMMYYFTDFFFYYNKNILLLSDHDQGKSLIVQSIIRKMIEQKKIISFNFGMQKSISLEVVQSHIENHLLKQGGNIIAPPLNNKVVIWLEDLHLSMSDSKPESLVRNLEVQEGWFSLNRHNFTKVKDANFVMTMSFHEDNIEDSRRILDSVNLDVLAKCTVAKFRKMSYGQFSTIFNEIVAESITMDAVNMSKGEKNLMTFYKQLAKVLYFNKDRLYRTTCSSLVNLNPSGLMHFAKTLNMIQWGTINQEEYMTNLVWMKLLKNFFKFDFPNLFYDFKKMIKSKYALNRSKFADRDVDASLSTDSMSVGANSTGMPSLQPDKKHFQSKIIKMRNSTFNSATRKSTFKKTENDFEKIKEEAKKRSSIDQGKSGEKDMVRLNTTSPQIKQGKGLSHFGRQYSRVNTKGAAKNYDKPGTLIIDEEDEFVEPNTVNLVAERKINKLNSTIIEAGQDDEDKSEESIENLIALDLERNKSPAQGELIQTVAEGTVHPLTINSGSFESKMTIPMKRAMGKGSIGMKKQISIRTDLDNSIRQKIKNEKLEPLTLQGAERLQEIKEMEDKHDGSDNENESLEEYEIHTENPVEEPPNIEDLKRQNTGRKSSFSRQSTQKKSRRQSIIEEIREDRANEIQRSQTPGIQDLTVSHFKRFNTDIKTGFAIDSLKDKIEQDLDQVAAEEDKEEDSDTIKLIPMPSDKDNSVKENTVQSIPEEDSDEDSFKSSTQSSEINSIEELKLKDQYEIKNVSLMKDLAKSIVSMTMEGTVPEKNQKTLSEACIFNKFFLFDISIADLDRRDTHSKINDEDALFGVIDAENEKKLMGFMRTKLTNFVYTKPEALYALKLNGCNFSFLLNDFANIHIHLKANNQHLMINSFKALLYSRYLTYFVCKSLFNKFYYIDLMNHESTKINEEHKRKFNSYQYLIQIIYEHFADLWSDSRIVIMVHIPNRALTSSLDLLNDMLGLIDSIIFNTDLMIYHFGNKIKKMLNIIKSDSLYSHFPENHLIYMFRNKIQSRVNFVIISELSKYEVQNSDMESFNEQNEEQQILKKYLFENYPKLFSKLKKLCINGMLMGGDEDIPEFYEKVTPLSDLSPSVIFTKGYRIQLNFLKVLDRDYEFMNMVRPMDENLLLYEQVIKALYNKFEIVENRAETQGMMREQMLILQKIKRRNEILKIESDQFENMIKSKEREKSTIEKTNSDLVEQRDKLSKQKNKLVEAIANLEKRVAGYKKEESIFKELEQKLDEVTKSIISMPDRDFLKSIKLNNFFGTRIFAIYSVLFHEIFKIDVKDQLDLAGLSSLGEDNINLDRCENYIIGFSRILEDFELLKSYLNYTGKRLLDEQMVIILGDIIQKSYDDSFVQMNKTQKNIMKWIDLVIEWTRFGLNKDQRERHLVEIERKIETVGKEIKTRTTLLQKIHKSLEEQPTLVKTVVDKINFFKEKRHRAEFGMKKTKSLYELLQTVNERYTGLLSVFKSKYMEKDTMIELLASFIIFWSQYPYIIKKSLFFTHIKSLEQEPNVFNENPIFEILGTDELLTEALKSKIPFNTNFLNNVAICEFIHGNDVILPFPLIYDPSGSYLKWLFKKYPDKLSKDYYTPTPKTEEIIQSCLENGYPYLAVDPGYELLKIIHGIIDWKFKQFCQNIIKEFEEENEALQEQEEQVDDHKDAESSNMDSAAKSKSKYSAKTRARARVLQGDQFFVSNELVFNGKKIPVGSGFKLYIILEKNTIDSLDESLMAKVLLMNNSLDEKKIWKESMKDELLLHFNSDTRAVVVHDYLSKGMMTKIFHKYRKLNEKLKSFDFLTDNLESGDFSKIMKLTEDVDGLTMAFEEQNKKRVDNLNSARSHSDFKQTVHSTIVPLMEKIMIKPESIYNFLNYDYYYKVEGMKKLTDNYELLSSRLYVYQKVIKSLRPFVGTDYFGTLDIFTHRIKQVVDVYKGQMKLDWIKEEDKFQKMIDDETDDEEIEDLQKELDDKIKKRKSEMEKLVAKMEKSIYYQIVNAVPYEKRYIISFLLGVIFHTDTIQAADSGAFKNFIDQLRIFLYSEKLMPKENRRILFTNNNLYVKYNNLFSRIKKHFTQTSSNLPEIINIDHNFDARFDELRQLEKKFDEDLDGSINPFRQFSINKRKRINSIDITQSQATEVDEPPSPTRSTKMVPLQEMKGFEQRKPSSSRSIQRKRKRRTSFVQSTDNTLRLRINAIRIQAQLETNTLDTKAGSDQKLDSNRFLFRQMTHIASKDKSSKKEKETEQQLKVRKSIQDNTLSLNFNEKGEVSFNKDMPEIAEEDSSDDSNSSNSSNTDVKPQEEVENNLLVEMKKSNTSKDGEKKPRKSGVAHWKSLRHLIKKVLNDNKKKKAIIKVAKSKKALFTHNFRTFMVKVMKIMLDRNDVNQGFNKAWRDYCHNSLFSLIGATEQSLMPATPIGKKTLDNWNLISLLTFFKLSRPDLINYSLSVLYAEIKSPKYYEVPLSLPTAVHMNWFGKPTIVLYRRMNINPADKIKEYAKSQNITLTKLDLEMVELQDLYKKIKTAVTMGEWIVMENIQLISREKSISIMKAFLEILDKEFAKGDYKTWILYHVKSNPYDRDLSTKENYGLPEWFSSCYKIFLNKNHNIFSEMSGLYSKEIKENNIMIKSDIEADLMDLKEKQRKKNNRKASHERKREGKSALKSKERTEEIEESSDIFNKKNIFNFHDQILVKRQQAGNFKSGQFLLDTKKEMVYKLKFIFSLMRQRNPQVDILQDMKFKFTHVHLSDKTINLILEKVISIIDLNIEEQFSVVFKYLVKLFFPNEMVDCFQNSPLLFENFYEIFVYSSTSKNVMLNFGRQKYLLPGSDLANSKFSFVFKHCLMNYPYLDNIKLMGLKNNEEKLINYKISRNSFKLLSNLFKETGIGDEKSNYLDHNTLNLFVQLNQGTNEEVIDASVVDSLEYGVEIMTAFEKNSQRKNTASKLLQDIIEGFDDEAFALFEEVLVGERVSSPASGSPIRRKRNFNPEDHLMSPVRRKFREDMMKYSSPATQSMFSKSTMNYKTFAFQQNNSQNKDLLEYKKYFLLHEFRTLKKLISIVLTDLRMAKYYLDGEVNHRSKQRAIEILDSFYKNKIPEPWIQKLSSFNLCMKDFSLLIRSLMMKYDNLYYLTISLHNIMPPILDLSRLLDPSSFLTNAALFNNIKFKKSMIKTCLMVRNCEKGSSRMYDDSLVFKIRGIKIKGGRINSSTGMLEVEKSREFVHDLGSLQLEFCHFEEKESMRFLDGEPTIPIIYNTKFNEQENNELVFENSIRDMLSSQNFLKKKREQNSKDGKNLANRFSLIQGGLLNYVRIPVAFSSQRNRKSFLHLNFYFYCYSMKPQIYWLKKGTHVVIEDSFK